MSTTAHILAYYKVQVSYITIFCAVVLRESILRETGITLTTRTLEIQEFINYSYGSRLGNKLESIFLLSLSFWTSLPALYLIVLPFLTFVGDFID